jgi:DNA-binding NarL/FixJ family response regulator
MIKVLIADKNFLSRIGLEFLVGELNGFELVPTVCGDKHDLISQLQLSKPNLLITDFSSLGIEIDELKTIIKKFPKIRFLVITEMLTKNNLNKVLQSGITSYLLKD